MNTLFTCSLLTIRDALANLTPIRQQQGHYRSQQKKTINLCFAGNCIERDKRHNAYQQKAQKPSSAASQSTILDETGATFLTKLLTLSKPIRGAVGILQSCTI